MEAPGDFAGVLAAAQRGEAAGYEALFRWLGAPVAGYLRARRVDDADGVANEVLLRVFRTITTFSGDQRRFRSWVFTIAHHAAIDEHRRAGRRPQPSGHGPADAPGGDVEDDAFDVLEGQRVMALLDTLTDDQREVLLLRVVADLSVEQTAELTGKGYEAVKALQRRGLAALRRALDAEQQGVPR